MRHTPAASPSSPSRKLMALIMPMIQKDHDGTPMYLTLDFAFSQRVRDAGFKVFLDSRIILGHMGTKMYAVQRQ